MRRDHDCEVIRELAPVAGAQHMALGVVLGQLEAADEADVELVEELLEAANHERPEGLHGLGPGMEDRHLCLLGEAALLGEVAEHERDLERRGRAAVRPAHGADEHPAAAEIAQTLTEPDRGVELPGRLEAGREGIVAEHRAEGDDQRVVLQGAGVGLHTLRVGVDRQHLGLQYACSPERLERRQRAAYVLGLPLPRHDPQVARPVLVPGAPVDEGDLDLVRLRPLGQPPGRDRAAGAAAEDEDAFGHRRQRWRPSDAEASAGTRSPGRVSTDAPTFVFRLAGY